VNDRLVGARAWRRLLGAALLVVVLAVSACGGGDGGGGEGGGGDGRGGDGRGGEASGPSAEEWVRNLCDEGVAWQHDLNERGRELQAESGQATSVAGVRDTIARYFRGAARRTDEFVADVERNGPPDAEDGERIARQVRTFLVDIRTAFADFADDAAQLPVDDPSAFQAGIQEQLTAFTNEVEDLGSDFEQLDAPDEYDRAFDEYEPCQEFRRGSNR
jgi:hypothetical protein